MEWSIRAAIGSAASRTPGWGEFIRPRPVLAEPRANKFAPTTPCGLQPESRDSSDRNPGIR